MSGFEVFNNAGSTVINSDQVHTLFDAVDTPGIVEVGAYNQPSPFGNLSELGFTAHNWSRKQDFLYWIQLTTNNAWCFPGANMFKPGTFRVIRTTRNKAVQSGFLDVFDSSGKLIWSAKSAATMPRIMKYVDIPQNHNLNSSVFSLTPGFNPFFLWNQCPGNLSDDGEVVGYSGVFIRWTGSQIQFGYTSKYQRTYQQVFNGRGNFRLPLAKFQGYN